MGIQQRENSLKFTKREHQARSQEEISLLRKRGSFVISVKERVGLIVGLLAVLIPNRTVINFIPCSFSSGMPFIKSNILSQNLRLQTSVSKHWGTPGGPLHVSSKCAAHVGALTSGAGAISVSVPCHWISFPCLDCLTEPQWKGTCLVLLGLGVPG